MGFSMITTQTLFDSLPEKILLVGNANITNKAEVIDSYDYVIRFNDFKITGYEQHVGKKTSSICFFSPIFSQGDGVKLKENYNMYKDRITIFTIKYFNYTPLKNILMPEQTTKIIDQHPINKGITLTTGCALALNLSIFWDRQIHMIGFDFLKTGHYYEENHIHCTTHDGNLEQKILKTCKNITII